MAQLETRYPCRWGKAVADATEQLGTTIWSRVLGIKGGKEGMPEGILGYEGLRTLQTRTAGLHTTRMIADDNTVHGKGGYQNSGLGKPVHTAVRFAG